VTAYTLSRMTREEIEKAFEDEGLSPHSWSNHANYRYAAHAHDYDKILYCVQGDVTFHLSDGDVVLHPGQRIEIPAGIRHAATVGPDGVECMEAPKYHRRRSSRGPVPQHGV
jgi:quercetin dioxygenase-like cupin family protein